MATAGSGHMEWTIVGDRKRSASLSQDSNKVPRINQPVEVTNRYAPLSSLQPDEGNTTENVPNNTKIPPINITGNWPRGVTSYSGLITFLTQIGGEKSFTLRSNVRGVVLYPSSPASYRTFIRSLKDSGCEYHTYQLPEDRMPYVVIRGLHHTTPIEEIKNELAEKGYKTLKITNILDRNKHPLPLFFVEIDKSTFNDEIYELSYLFYTKIKVEEPRRKRQIMQCGRCQRFNHTKSYCTLPFRCIRCGGEHDSKTCLKTRDTPATCANCQGSHPANYRGCTVYKDLRNHRSMLHRSNLTQPAQRIPSMNEYPPLAKKMNNRESHVHSTISRDPQKSTYCSREVYSAVLEKRKRSHHYYTDMQAQESDQPSIQTQKLNQHVPQMYEETYNHRDFHPLPHQDLHLRREQAACHSSIQSPMYQQQNRNPRVGPGEEQCPAEVPPQLTSILSGISQILQPLFNLLSQLTHITQTLSNTHYDN